MGESLGRWGWRNFADLFRFHLGSDAREVFAVTRQYEPFRYTESSWFNRPVALREIEGYQREINDVIGFLLTC